jgi:hypothetical protein
MNKVEKYLKANEINGSLTTYKTFKATYLASLHSPNAVQRIFSQFDLLLFSINKFHLVKYNVRINARFNCVYLLLGIVGDYLIF